MTYIIYNNMINFESEPQIKIIWDPPPTHQQPCRNSCQQGLQVLSSEKKKVKKNCHQKAVVKSPK